jgi:hypothetical protein
MVDFIGFNKKYWQPFINNNIIHFPFFAYNLLWRKLLQRVPLKMMGRYMGQSQTNSLKKAFLNMQTPPILGMGGLPIVIRTMTISTFISKALF